MKIDALKERIQNIAPNGDSAEQGATRLQALKEWESRTTVDFGMLQLWPVLPRTWAALKVFLNQDSNLKPNSITSMRFRWTIGISDTLYG